MTKQNLGPIIFGSVILVAAVLVGAWLMGYWEKPPPAPPSPAAAYIYHPPPVPDAPVEVPPPAVAAPTETASEEAPAPDPTLAQEMEKQAADQAAEAQQVEMQRQESAITNNLRQFAAGSQQYMLDKGVTQASYQDVVGTETDKYIRSIAPVAGENYESMTVYQTTTQISITTPDGRVVQYNL
jgi:type IV secretory pathway VirB10-like protein